MSVKDTALAALDSVRGMVEKMGAPETPPEVLTIAAAEIKPTAELLAEKERADKAEAKAAALESEKVDRELDAKVEALCERAHLAPAFKCGLKDFMAGKPDVRLDAEGTKTLPRDEFLAEVLERKGIEKLDDPLKLTKPPAKKKANMLTKASGPELPKDPETLEAIADRAVEICAAKGISMPEGMKQAIDEWRKEGE